MAVKQRIIISFVIFSVLFFNLHFVFCQDVKSIAPALSLTEVVLTAFKNNKDIQIQEKEILIVQAGIFGSCRFAYRDFGDYFKFFAFS